MSRTINVFVLLLVLSNVILQCNAGSDLNRFFNGISQTAKKIKGQLLEFFYRFRAFFIRHTESTHQLMTTRGCGYAVDDEPAIYNKQSNILAKIKGGDTALWHTWYAPGIFSSELSFLSFVKAMDGWIVYQCSARLELCRCIDQ